MLLLTSPAPEPLKWLPSWQWTSWTGTAEATLCSLLPPTAAKHGWHEFYTPWNSQMSPALGECDPSRHPSDVCHPTLLCVAFKRNWLQPQELQTCSSWPGLVLLKYGHNRCLLSSLGVDLLCRCLSVHLPCCHLARENTQSCCRCSQRSTKIMQLTFEVWLQTCKWLPVKGAAEIHSNLLVFSEWFKQHCF